MNTNDNTEPCPTCSMTVNKSAIKLAARVAELERENENLQHEASELRRLVFQPPPSVSEDPKIIRNMSTPETRAFWESAERSAEDVATWPDWKRAGINVSAQRIEPRTSEAVPEVSFTAEGETVHVVDSADLKAIERMVAKARAQRPETALHGPTIEACAAVAGLGASDCAAGCRGRIKVMVTGSVGEEPNRCPHCHDLDCPMNVNGKGCGK